MPIPGLPGLTCKYHRAIPAERYWWRGPAWGRFKSPGHLDLCGDCLVQRQAAAVEDGDSLYTDQQCRSRVQVSHEPRADGSATAKPGPRLDAPTPNAEPETVPQPLDPGVGAGVEGHLPAVPQEPAMPNVKPDPTCAGCGKVGPLKAKGRCPKCYDRQHREAKKSKLAPKPGRLPLQRSTPKPRAVLTKGPPATLITQGFTHEDLSAVLHKAGLGEDITGDVQSPEPPPCDLARQRRARLCAAIAVHALQAAGVDEDLLPEWNRLLGHLDCLATGRRELPL